MLARLSIPSRIVCPVRRSQFGVLDAVDESRRATASVRVQRCQRDSRLNASQRMWNVWWLSGVEAKFGCLIRYCLIGW
ncbi:hypothetical protein FHS27_002361 [Rhodopirellula rubra]|uniref:Uncharacterized protein n=1 Tax=Aporhodopirellula rubra TaxID=980271 RepID=A0A7W5DZM4_9BACT|nr:hypothetical protein [Aporhodopirellula rubra]